MFLFVYHSAQVIEEKLNLLYFVLFSATNFISIISENLKKKHLEADKNGRTGWQNMNTTTVTFSLISFSSSQFYFYIFFFFSPSYLSLSFASFFYHYFDQPQAFLKLLWRRSDNTIHSLFYLAMALSSFRIEKIFLNFDFFLPNNLHSFILGKLKHFLK